MAEQGPTQSTPPKAEFSADSSIDSVPESQETSAGNPFTTLGDDKLYATQSEERYVSSVYIDRHTIYNYYGAVGGAGGSPTRQSPVTRIGDVVVSALPTGDIVAVQATFTPPICFDAAQRMLREQGIVLLLGPAGSGKRSAAIKLLSSISYEGSKSAAIYELNPDLRLADLDPQAIPPNTPLLLETPGGGALLGMSSFHWGEFARRLAEAKQNNGLVIALEQAPAAFDDRRNLVVKWQAAWPGERTAVQWNILQRHLSYRLAQENLEGVDLEQQLDGWQQDASLASLLAAHLAPGQIARLADLLLDVLAGRCGLKEALARHESHVAEAVQCWFEDTTCPLDVKTLLLAAAVCNEALADEVEAAAAGLLQLLAPSNEKAEAPPADPFAAGSTRSRRLKQIGASLVQMPLHGLHYGSSSGQVLRLDNSAWQRAVINYVWNEVSPLREPLLIWLERLVANGSQRLRVRAAAALGALARLNFPLIEARILRPWACSSNPDLRRAAAQVLGITMWDEQHSAASAALLRHWAGLPDWRFCWTAATACGGLAGQRYLQQTLDTLGRIAEACVERQQLLEPVTQAALNLFLGAAGAHDQRAIILHNLRQWSERQATARSERERVFAARRTALLCFWMILLPAPHDPAWRQLVEDMAVPQSPLQEDGVALLRASLNFRQRESDLPVSVERNKLIHPSRRFPLWLRTVSESVAKEGGDLFDAWTGVLQALVAASQRADTAARDGEEGIHDGEECKNLRCLAEEWGDLPPNVNFLRNLLL